MMERNDKVYCLEEMLQLLESNGLAAENSIREQDKGVEILELTYDSREVRLGTLFICKGAHFEPRYLEAAKEAGAVAYVSEKIYDNVNLPYIIVNDIKRAMALLADMYFNSPWKRLTTIGLTGTKGKSTTTYFLKYIINDYMEAVKKQPCGVLSSIDNYDGVISEESHLTTPEAVQLHRHFHNAVSTGIEYFLMEVSSQALKYDRTYGIIYDVGGFLNIGEDHISAIEHSSFDDYFESKLKLLSQCKTAVLNKNTDKWDEVLKAAKTGGARLIIFGTDEDCDVYGYDVQPTADGIDFRARCGSFDDDFHIRLHGIFNVDNALAAIAVCYAMDIPVRFIKSGLAKAQVSGRMEIYTGRRSRVNVIVDYAHNKMSFQSLFDSTKKEFPEKNISIVFGCPGKKALARRRELGSIAGTYSKMVYITEEDAGEEPVMDICREIAGYVEQQGCEYEIIPDRGEAIKRAIDDADADGNTIVLITGKGRETRQKRGILYVDTPSDVEYVEKFLKEK